MARGIHLFIRRRISLLLLLSLGGNMLLPVAALGDDAPPRSLCWRGRPCDECQSFLITELGIGTRFRSFSDHSPYDDTDLYLIGALGFMYNLESSSAIGGSFNLDTDLWLLSITPRYRRWLNDLFAADVSAGVILARLDNERFAFPGFRADLGASFADIVSLNAGMEVIPTYDDDRDVAWHLESRLGSYPAAIGAGGLAIAIGALIVVFLSSDWD